MITYRSIQDGWLLSNLVILDAEKMSSRQTKDAEIDELELYVFQIGQRFNLEMHFKFRKIQLFKKRCTRDILRCTRDILKKVHFFEILKRPSIYGKTIKKDALEISFDELRRTLDILRRTQIPERSTEKPFDILEIDSLQAG